MKKTVSFIIGIALIIAVIAFVKVFYIGTYSTDGETLQQLKILAESNSDAAKILKHYKRYPESFIQLAVKNPETTDFVLGYPNRFLYKNDSLNESDINTERTVPLFMQWDKRWGYTQYNKNFMALSGCGPTSVSMVAVYLTGDITLSPKRIAEFSEENGYCVEGNGTSWTLMSDGCKKLGLNVEEVPLMKSLIFEKLDSGQPIICHMGKGFFTTTGHYIVFTGAKDGLISVNDPNSIKNSETLWDYDDIKDQIINMWAISR